ncbi:MAG TPA: hypothetical protein VHA75_00915 [Rugosimonospora sp.]|nr:hypothetical protein [Rugosimonospora sp.]
MYLMDINPDALLGPAEAALAVNVTKHTVRKWRTIGWVDPATGLRTFLAVAGNDRHGNPLHRLGDLLEAERATRRSGTSHRQPVAA